jgi:hypothetical protein
MIDMGHMNLQFNKILVIDEKVEKRLRVGASRTSEKERRLLVPVKT